MTETAAKIAEAFQPGQALEEGIAEQAAAELAGYPDDVEIPEELRQCGAVIDKAIGFLVEQNLQTELIASALLGGSLGVLARTTDTETMIRMLQTAIEGIRAGELVCPEENTTGE